MTGTYPIPIEGGRSYRCFPVKKPTGIALRVAPVEGPIEVPGGGE